MIALFFSVMARASDLVQPSIDQAQALALKKNRVEACAILQKTIQALPNGGKGRSKLAESIKHISTVFFTDKGQRQFEAGLAVMWESPDIALEQFKQALELEDQNTLVLSNIARIQIMKQDCEQASVNISAARKLNAFDGDLIVLDARANTCLGKYEILRDKNKTQGLDKWQQAMLWQLQAQENLEQKSWRKAHELAQKVAQELPGFPEAQFVLLKAGSELGKDVDEATQRYITLCKAITNKERKQFSLEPRLCASLKDVENEFGKKTFNN